MLNPAVALFVTTSPRVNVSVLGWMNRSMAQTVSLETIPGLACYAHLLECLLTLEQEDALASL